MRALLLIFSLAVIRAESDNLKWEKLEIFKQFFSVNKINVEQFVNSTLNVMRNTIESSSDILDEIERWAMPWENSSWAKTNCTFKSLKKDSLKELFLIDLRSLEEPVMKRIEYLRKRLVEISSTISMLDSIAHFKNHSCLISNGDCLEKIEAWVEENVSLLKCRIVKHCQKHVISKRSNTCSSDQFRCRNGNCIDVANICTGTNTCSDGSDEGPQCKKYCFSGFHCTNLKCIDKLLVCDGKDDCGDDSDEAGCAVVSRNCSRDMGMFQCKNNKCIPLTEVCNGLNGCGDGSDEGGLCGRGCPGRCRDLSGVCLTTPSGPVCVNKCPPGSVDTASGCLPPPEIMPKSVEEVLEDMPRIIERYISSVYQLKQATLSFLFKASVDFSKCNGDDSFNKIIRFTNFNETNYSNYTYVLKNN